MRSRAKLTIVVSVCALISIIMCLNINYTNVQYVQQLPTRANFIESHVKVGNKKSSVTPASIVQEVSFAPIKHVTKSLAELGKMDEVSKHIVMLNAVPNSGSEILVLLLKWLQGWNNFKHVKLRGSKKKLSNIEAEEFVYNTYDIIRDEAVPISFDRMIFFVNFTRYDRQSPSYINLIREPADYLLSRFHHLMQNADLRHLKTSKHIEECIMSQKKGCVLENGKEYDLSIPYFCGQHAKCQQLNDEWALKQAQITVEKYYATLGVLEEVNATLDVLEHELPYFFKGASKLYYRDLLQPFQKNRNKTPKASDAFRKRMRLLLHKEYEFYDWAKSRLFRQLQLSSAH